MIIGETISSPDGDTTIYYSPWFPAKGASATFSFVVVAAHNASLTLGVETKNSENTDAEATGLGTISKSSTGADSLRVTDIQQLVRFLYTLLGTAGDGTDGFMHLYVNEPMWECCTGTS